MIEQLQLWPAGPEVAPASPWCLRWRPADEPGGQPRHAWRHLSEGGFDRRWYEVGPLDEATARRFVVAAHYSRSFPAARLCYGLWERGGFLVGAAVLSVPARAEVLTNVLAGLDPYRESLELGRFCLVDAVPANGESFFLARAFRLAADAGIRGVVSFADPVARRDAAGRVVFPGHVGWIYQAAGAVFTGRGTARTLALLPDGTVLNERAAQKLRSEERGREYVERRLREQGAPARRSGEDGAAYLRRALAAVGARQLRHGGPFRYAFRVGRTRRERAAVRIALPGRPFPKAVDDAGG